MTKLITIGLDGATLDLIEPWARQGFLPNLNRLMQQGVYGRLQSVLPVLSSSAWPSFMTGMNPGKHGLYDFVKRAPDSYQLRPVNRTHMKQPTLWGILSQQGRRVGIVNVPMTYPPERVNGFMITGLGTPDFKPFTHPAELSPKLSERGYYVTRRGVIREGDEENYLKETSLMAENILDASLWMMEQEQWDYFMVVFYDTDQLGHYFWHFMDESHPKHIPGSKYTNAIRDYYQQVDAAIGKLVEKAGPDTNVMIMSDHGTGAFYKDVFLNEWLKQEGFLVLVDQKSAPGSLKAGLASIGINRENISTVLRKIGLRRLEFFIKEVLGERINVLAKASHTQFPDVIDWSKTKAYSFGYHGQIFINLKGREPQGIVAEGEAYNQVCEQIQSKLMELKDPEDNLPVVDRVYRRDEAFWGSAMQDAPDMVVVMRGFSYITRTGYEFGPKPGEIVTDPVQHQTGSHRMEGVWMMAGPDIQPKGYIGSQTVITDLAPTILHLLGCPIPDTMDGKVVAQWLLGDQQVQLASAGEMAVSDNLEFDGTTEEDEEKLIQRLKDLGYLE